MSDLSEKLAALDAGQFEDDQRVAEGSSPSVQIDRIIDWKYQEHLAFETRWAGETVLIQRLRDMLTEGQKVLHTIYTYRSCSMCMPQVKNQEQENRFQIYENTCAVLETEVKKLKDFLFFQRTCIKFFGETVKYLSKKDEVSEILKWYLVQLLDLLSLLDSLKNMKASLNNDFSAYKRAAGFLRKGQTAAQDDQTQENHTLYLFLAHPNAITSNLRDELKECEDAEKVLLSCALMCATALETERYVLPSEKHCLLRVLPYALYLLDVPDDPKRNVFKSKVLNMQQLARYFRRYPVVTVYGDMQLPMDVAIKRTPHYDDRAWQSLVPPDPRVVNEYLLVHQVAGIRAQHDEFVGRFSQLVNEVRLCRAEKKPGVADPVPLPMARDVVATVLQGVQLMSDWAARIIQQAAWKYANPNMSKDIQTEVDYERAIKFNYRLEERSALVEVIAMCKGLARLVLKHDTFLAPVIRSAIHSELQEFVQVTLTDMIAEATKKKKAAIRNDLAQLRAMSADWAGGFEPFVEASLHASKKGSSKGGAAGSSDAPTIPRRQVGPSGIQLDLMRDIVYGLLQQRKEFGETKHVKMLEEFYARSLFYPYLLDLPGTVARGTDIGELWYREFYLELSKRLQFPIEMSLPSILVDHVLERAADGSSPELIEYALYPLDIYNDAASRALRDLKTRFLYDEIEAEVNLCFDQLLFKLSEQVYASYKTQASSILLDKSYRAQIETVMEGGAPLSSSSSAPAAGRAKYAVPKNRYEVLLGQRHVQLLGRIVDLNRLVTQRVNRMLRQNVDYAISRFEASDLSSVVELDQALINIKLTHSLISRVLDVDPWELVLVQGNESASISSFHNRILLHVLFEIASDFAPNYNYNSATGRFLRGPVAFGEPPPRDPAPKPNHTFLYGGRHLHAAYAVALESHRRLVGAHHILALVHLLGRTHLPMLVSEMLRNIDLKIRSVVMPYVTELTSGLPASSKLPLHQYGTQGSYGMFAAKLTELIAYPDLKLGVLRHFKEIGNAIALMQLFDQTLKQSDLMSFIESAPVLGVTPQTLATPVPPGGEDPSSASPLYTVVSAVSAFLPSFAGAKCTPQAAKALAENAWRADKYHRQGDNNVSLFRSVLSQINSIVDGVRGDWRGEAHPPENLVMDVEGPHEFYRLWSALEFVLCMPQTGKDEPQHSELYGDGINWAGCTLIYLLGQRYRFETLSFTYHTLNIEDAAAQRCTEPNMLRFLRNAAIDRELNSTIFSALATYLPIEPVNATLTLNPPETLQLKYFIEMSSSDGPGPAGAFPVSAPARPPVQPVSSAPAPPPAAPDEGSDEEEEPPAPPETKSPSPPPPPPSGSPPPMPPRPGR